MSVVIKIADCFETNLLFGTSQTCLRITSSFRFLSVCMHYNEHTCVFLFFWYSFSKDFSTLSHIFVCFLRTHRPRLFSMYLVLYLSCRIFSAISPFSFCFSVFRSRFIILQLYGQRRRAGVVVVLTVARTRGAMQKMVYTMTRIEFAEGRISQ